VPAEVSGLQVIGVGLELEGLSVILTGPETLIGKQAVDGGVEAVNVPDPIQLNLKNNPGLFPFSTSTEDVVEFGGRDVTRSAAKAQSSVLLTPQVWLGALCANSGKTMKGTNKAKIKQHLGIEGSRFISPHSVQSASKVGLANRQNVNKRYIRCA
jgi:hypothetical protein